MTEIHPVTELLLVWWIDEKNDDSLVYFVRNPSNRLIKIGYTIDLDRRLSTLRIAIPDLELIGTIRGGRRAEGDLHATFANNRVAGEWFLPDLDMADQMTLFIGATRALARQATA